MILPSLVPSRTSGVAPLAVHFDATATTSATVGIDTFRQVTYAFNFGDDRGQSWAVSGKPKNSEVGGPIAAHVFDLPGTYTVTLQATDPSGAVAQTSVTITVQDPAAFYSGTKTVCVSTTTDFSGCPTGATQQNSLPTGTGWNGKRVLLKRGQDFTTLGSISIQDGNSSVQVGAFGSGAKPIVHSVGVGDGRPNTASFANDVSIIDLATRGKMAQGIGHRVLFYRNDLTNPRDSSSGFYFGDEYFTYRDPYRFVPSSSFYNARELFYVENTVVGNTSTDYNAFGFGARMAWLGNDFSTTKWHNLRIIRTYKSVLAHNRLRGISSTGGYHSLKLHAGGLTAYADNSLTSGTTWASRYIVTSSNEFGSATDNNTWTIALCPQNDQSAEGLEDVVAENNRFIRGSQTSVDLTVTGRRITYRGNTNASQSASVGLNGHGAALPTDWKSPYFSQ